MAEYSIDELKPNSNASREQKEAEETSEEQRPRMQRIGSGASKARKKPIKQRLFETFIDEEFTWKGLRSYIVKDIIAPAIQDAIMDGVNGALGMMFGIGIVRKGASRGTTSSSSKIRYGGYFNSGNDSSRSSTRSSTKSESRRRTDSSKLEVQMKDNEAEAKQIMAQLEELLIDYPENGVTVCDYYDAFGVTTESTDNHWGWTDLRGMHLERCPRAFYDKESGRHLTGWAVVMPPVEYLE